MAIQKGYTAKLPLKKGGKHIYNVHQWRQNRNWALKTISNWAQKGSDTKGSAKWPWHLESLLGTCLTTDYNTKTQTISN